MANATLDKPVKTKEAKNEETKPLRKFRLLVAGCEVDGKLYQVDRDPTTKQMRCPVIETDKDLCKMFNVSGFAPKFAYLEEAEVIVTDPTQRMPGESIQEYLLRLEDVIEKAKKSATDAFKEVDVLVTREEVEDFAEGNEIDIPATAKTVEQMKAVIKNALKTK